MSSTYFTIYRTTNNINGKIYIGKHVTTDLDDDYYGSGVLINRAISKYGKHNFRKEILFIFDDEISMNNKEKEIVNEEFCKRDDTYNLTTGGYGSWHHINNNPNQHIFIEKMKMTMANKPEEEISEINRKKINRGEKNGMYGKNRSGENNPRYGVILSEDTKKKISESLSGRKATEETKQKLSISQKNRWNETPDEKIRRSEIYKERGIKPPSPKGMLWWNNGTQIIRSKECPGPNWNRGRKLNG